MYLVINKCVTAVEVSNFSGHYLSNRSTSDIGVLPVYFNIRNTLPKSGTFLLAQGDGLELNLNLIKKIQNPYSLWEKCKVFNPLENKCNLFYGPRSYHTVNTLYLISKNQSRNVV